MCHGAHITRREVFPDAGDSGKADESDTHRETSRQQCKSWCTRCDSHAPKLRHNPIPKATPIISWKSGSRTYSRSYRQGSTGGAIVNEKTDGPREIAKALQGPQPARRNFAAWPQSGHLRRTLRGSPPMRNCTLQAGSAKVG